MDTNKIQKIIGKVQVLKKHSLVIENIQPFCKYEYDILSISKSGKVYEFEVKISRSDFLKPKERTKMVQYAGGPVNGRVITESGYVHVPNFFSYCCPEGLINLNEIPAFSGLYYVSEDGRVTEVRKPARIHKHNLYLPRIYTKVLRYYSERHFLGGCFMTYKNKLVR